jgi:hypothetical protein
LFDDKVAAAAILQTAYDSHAFTRTWVMRVSDQDVKRLFLGSMSSSRRAPDQRHASAAVMTNSETFYDADLECANMFPPGAALAAYAENCNCPRCPGDSLSIGVDGQRLSNSMARTLTEPPL